MNNLYKIIFFLAVAGQLVQVVQGREQVVMDRDPCSNRKLCNGGVCRATKGGGYICSCPEGFKGKHCQIKDCQDDHQLCVYWASIGECTKNPHYMLRKCRKSCNYCEGCKDDDDNCKRWATTGECTNNPNWMLVHCKKSCLQCIK